MLLHKGFKFSLSVCGAALLLSGCSSTIFPDFDEGNEIVVHEGGRVEMRKIEGNGILIADKDNAAYEDEENAVVVEDKVAEVDEITPAKVIEVKAEEIDDPKDNVKIVEASAEIDEVSKVVEPEAKVPSMHYLATTVYFENGGAVVGSSYGAALKKIAKTVKENDAYVTVYGFASSRTRDTDPASHKLANFKISAERAESTAKALRRAGVPADKISTQALSDTMPMYQEVMPEGERLNRRAEIYLTY